MKKQLNEIENPKKNGIPLVLGKNKKAIPMFINIPHHDIRVVPSAEERMVRGKANHSNTSSMIG